MSASRRALTWKTVLHLAGSLGILLVIFSATHAQDGESGAVIGGAEVGPTETSRSFGADVGGTATMSDVETGAAEYSLEIGEAKSLPAELSDDLWDAKAQADGQTEQAKGVLDEVHEDALKGLKTLDATSAFRFALASIRNDSGYEVGLQFRWGKSEWRNLRAPAGRSVWFWYQYPVGSRKSPSLYVKWDYDTRPGWSNAVVILQRRAAAVKDERFASKYAFRYRPYYTDRPAPGEIWMAPVDGVILPAYYTRVNRFSFGGRIYGGMTVRDIDLYGVVNWRGNWDYKIVIDADVRDVACRRGHRVGQIRVRLSGPGGGYLDTGPVACPFATREIVFHDVQPGKLNYCRFWCKTWCEWY